MKNPHAQALGKLGGLAGAGKPKRLTPEDIAKRRVRLEVARRRRWPKK